MALKGVIVIPARGGYQSLSRKNLRKIMDVSLVEWALAACELGSLSVIVSTNDPEIKAVAEKHGVDVCHRSEDNEKPWTPDIQVAREVAYDSYIKNPDDFMIWLRPTSPFRSKYHVSQVIQFMMEFPAVDSLRSVVPVKEHPAKMYRLVGGAGPASDYELLAPWGPARDHRPNHPRQYLPEAYKAVGWIDAVRYRVIDSGEMEGYQNYALVPPDPDLRIDIDTEIDLQVANNIAENRGWRPGRCD